MSSPSSRMPRPRSRVPSPGAACLSTECLGMGGSIGAIVTAHTQATLKNDRNANTLLQFANFAVASPILLGVKKEHILWAKDVPATNTPPPPIII